MHYRTILVCLHNQTEAKRLLPVAVMMARKFNAHLIGAYSLQNMEIYASVSMQLSGNAISEMQTIQANHAQAVKQLFEQMTTGEDFVSEWRLIETSTAATGESLAQQARCADLVIMSQIEPEGSHPGPAAIQRHVIEHSGRPVLVIPRFANIEDIGQRILVGWSGTGECTRAVFDSLAFCQTSREVRIFWISGTDESRDALLEETGHNIAKTLARHQVAAMVAHRPKTDIPIGDELLNEASDSGADLIVIGAYGHSRLYDFVIGATTTHLLRHMTVPVLFSN